MQWTIFAHKKRSRKQGHRKYGVGYYHNESSVGFAKCGTTSRVLSFVTRHIFGSFDHTRRDAQTVQDFTILAKHTYLHQVPIRNGNDIISYMVSRAEFTSPRLPPRLPSGTHNVRRTLTRSAVSFGERQAVFQYFGFASFCPTFRTKAQP